MVPQAHSRVPEVTGSPSLPGSPSSQSSRPAMRTAGLTRSGPSAGWWWPSCLPCQSWRTSTPSPSSSSPTWRRPIRPSPRARPTRRRRRRCRAKTRRRQKAPLKWQSRSGTASNFTPTSFLWRHWRWFWMTSRSIGLQVDLFRCVIAGTVLRS